MGPVRSRVNAHARLASTYGVSIGNKTGLLKDELLMLQKDKPKKRKAELRHKRTAADRVEACQRTKMRPILSYYLGNNLSMEAAETDDVDSALSVEVMEYSSFNSQLETCDRAHASTIRDRLWTFRDQMLAKNDAKAYLTINAYIKFEEFVRAGSSELQAGRLVATTFYAHERRPRKNACRNPTNLKYWYRYRARSIIIGYRYFYCSNSLLSETRGKCRGKSLIHDPVVQQLCRVIIHNSLGATWSARTFRYQFFLCHFVSVTESFIANCLGIRSPHNFKKTGLLRRVRKLEEAPRLISFASSKCSWSALEKAYIKTDMNVQILLSTGSDTLQ